nr:hypothetical protein [Tanacetum cinerariifolium]
MLTVKSKVLAPGMYVIDVEPIPPRNRNNREVHLDYLKHLKESVETLCEIVKEARVEKPFDSSLASACCYTKHSQELDFSMINDDEEHSIQYKEYLEKSSNTITTVLPTEEPEYSLSMGNEHLSTNTEMESDEVIHSSAKNLVPIPSEYEVTFDDESECDVPIRDESALVFTTFSNPIFDDNDDFTSSDDEGVWLEVVSGLRILLDHENPRISFRRLESSRKPDHEARSAPDLRFYQLDTFFNALNPNDQDALDSAAGGNFLDKIPRECLSIIKSKSKFRYSRSRVTDVRANAHAPPPISSSSNSFDLQQIAASLEDKLDIRMNRFEKSLNDMKNSFITPTAPLKAVAEVCVTCRSNHSYNNCPLTRGGNDFLVFHDNIQQFKTAAVGNFVQNRQQNVSNQMRLPRFNQPTQQNNNQNRFQGNNFNQNQNRQNNQGAVYQNRPQQNTNYQAPPQQNTVTQSKFEAYTTANDANMNNLHLKIDAFQKKFEQKQDD